MRFLLNLIFTLALLASTAAHADLRVTGNANVQVVQPGVYGQNLPPGFVAPVPYCPQTSIQVCGFPYMLGSGAIGNLQSFRLPDSYVTNMATFQCVATNGMPYYQLMNGDVANCAIKQCGQGDVEVCGVKVAVADNVKYGDSVDVTVPTSFLDTTRVTMPLKLTAQCNPHPDGLYYDVRNLSDINCNAFLCPQAELAVCDAKYVVTTPVPLGKVLELTTPANQPFRVECTGSMKGAPHFAVVDQKCN